MNRNLLKIASLAVCAFLFQSPAQAQSMRANEISQTVSDDPIDQGIASPNAPLDAANPKPTDLLGDIWKQADPTNATGDGSRRTNNSATTLKLPIGDDPAAADK